MEVLVERLEERLKTDPKSLDGWLMLGRTYFAMSQMEKGLDAIKRAYDLAPQQTEVMLAYAEALAAASPSKSLEGQPTELIKAALQQEPNNPTARWLDGMISFQRGQFQVATLVWQKILDELEPGSEEARNLGQMVEEAKRRAGQPTAAEPAQTASTETAPANEAPKSAPAGTETPAHGVGSVTVEVTLDASLAAQASPEETVFVFARAASGPPMPLAAQRIQVKDLPTTVTLDDGMAMTPALRLSAFPEVKIGARISKSGEATPQPGDLEGDIGPIKLDESGKVSVTIDRVRP